MKSMIFGASCSPSAAIFAMRKNAEEFKEEFPQVFHAVNKSYYMDDFIDCADTVDEAVEMMLNMIEVQKRGGFNLCNWTCSSKSVLEKIPCEMRAKAWTELEAD